MDDRRQKNQLVLAFMEEGRSEASMTSVEGTNRLREGAGPKARPSPNS
jgi:hypothetical protein